MDSREWSRTPAADDGIPIHNDEGRGIRAAADGAAQVNVGSVTQVSHWTHRLARAELASSAASPGRGASRAAT